MRAAVPLLLVTVLLWAGCARQAPEAETVAVAEAAYVGDEACASCHEDLYASYHRTGMGRSVSRFDRATAPERFDAEGRGPVVFNEASGYYYQALVRGDTLFQREFRRDAQGRVSYERLHRAAYVVGSGNATRSYLMRENGFVTEMPLTWYVERALWDMSPGYRTSNSRFSRPATLECVTCHDGNPEHTPFTQNHYADLPLGITCERCHGPAGAHVEARLAGIEPDEAEDVVNPARLERSLQLGVCQQCHLEGITVFAPGEDPTTFRPGRPLAAHRSVFARLDRIEDPDDFGIASHGLRLALSECYKESAMTCTTCHDPHRPTSDFGPDAFNATCRSCHDGSDAGHEAVCERPGTATLAEAMTGDCVSCHMRVGGTSDIPHVSFTDHWIRRVLPPARPPGPIEREAERTEPFTLVNLLGGDAPEAPGSRPRSGGEADLEAALATFQLYETQHRLPAYLPAVIAGLRRGLAAGADRPDARVALGRALLEMDSLAAAERALGEAAAAAADDAWASYWLGLARSRQGETQAALGPLRRAVEMQPLLVEARIALADALSATGQTDAAVAQLEAAVDADSLHHPAAWNNLGFLHLQAGRTAEAEGALAAAVRLDPLFAEARVNLGSVYLLTEQPERAVAQFEAAAQARPDYAPAYGNLGVAYLQLGRRADARRMFERLLALDPGDQRARAYLAQLSRGQG